MTGPSSPLLELLTSKGGVTGLYHGIPLVRHFGDAHQEYVAATESVAVFDRSHRARLGVSGRAPRQMLNGILTGTLPAPPESRGQEGMSGMGTYHAVLTPKGKMVTDLECLCRVGTAAKGPAPEKALGNLPGGGGADGEAEDFLLDVPVAGKEGLMEHLGRFLPPRFARVTDESAGTASLTVVGPESAVHVSRLALGLRVGADELSALPEGGWRAAGSPQGGAVMVVRTHEVWPEAYTLYGPAEAMKALWLGLVGGGAQPAGLGVWSTLRVEAGRPAFGTDMDASTIPVEAGIHDRAIDYAKGCYTGQEVIVRIRDRGHVNRTLRQLMLGDIPTPAHGTELFVDGNDKPVGNVTSAVQSPRFQQTIALAYVKRGVEGTPVPR